MKTIVLSTGEVAYVPTDSEKQIFQLALKELNVVLPRRGEDLNG